MSPSSTAMRRAYARNTLRRLKFVPVPPFRVEPFSGGLIRQGPASWATDFHIVDKRGRTVKVLPHREGSGSHRLGARRSAAQRQADAMNELVRERCIYCGQSMDDNALKLGSVACSYCADLPGLEAALIP